MSDNDLTIVLMRMLERILAVGIGGLTIYFGYRLFLLLPTQTTSDGKIELPGYSVVLSKVGPGVFFLAFGALVLYQSFSSMVSVGPNFAGAVIDMTQSKGDSPGDSELSSLPAHYVSPQELARLQLNLQVLNCANRVLNANEGIIPRDEIERSVRDAKLALMRDVWMTERWGDQSDFNHWVNRLEGSANEEALELYEAVMPGCTT